MLKVYAHQTSATASKTTANSKDVIESQNINFNN